MSPSPASRASRRAFTSPSAALNQNRDASSIDKSTGSCSRVGCKTKPIGLLDEGRPLHRVELPCAASFQRPFAHLEARGGPA